MKYLPQVTRISALIILTLSSFGCIEKATSLVECSDINENLCASASTADKTCGWLKSTRDNKYSCREIKNDCQDVVTAEDCFASGIVRGGAQCDYVSGACVRARSALDDQDKTRKRKALGDGGSTGTKPVTGVTKGTSTETTKPHAPGMTVINKAEHCNDVKANDPCEIAQNAEGQACGWNNLVDTCEIKRAPKRVAHSCEDFPEKTCDQEADKNGNNCAWDVQQKTCSAIVVKAPDTKTLGLCAQFETPDTCNESSDAQNNPCLWQRAKKTCEKWRMPLQLRKEKGCGGYKWANLCNRSTDLNNIACAWHRDKKVCEATAKPPLPPRDTCADYHDRDHCEGKRDGKGNLCAYSDHDAKCKTAADIAKELERFGPFALRTLKDWTDFALTFDEALVNSARFGREMQIPLGELELAIKEFAARASSSKLKDADNWLGEAQPKNSDFLRIDDIGQPNNLYYDDVDYYAEKQTLPVNARIIVMGDFHGSLHSLLRNLWRLHAQGYLNNDFKLAGTHVHLAFTGDFIDRGRYSAETLYTLLRLKIANFDQVHLVRGNHEDVSTATDYGFRDELLFKYDRDNGEPVFRDTMAILRFLPIVYFASFGTGAARSVLHFSHGGFSYDENAMAFKHEPKKLLDDPRKAFELLPAGDQLGYQWSDFEQNDGVTINGRGFDAGSGVVTIGLDTLREYMANNGVRAIFRGHQDMAFGLKMLFGRSSFDELEDKAMFEEARKNSPSTYQNGPFHWTDVVIEREDIEHAAIIGIPLTDVKYAPVFTFTTAAEARQMLYDSFGIIKAANKWDDFRLEVHENRLPEELLGNYAFVNIAPAEENDDGVNATWSLEGPGRCYINP